MQDKDFKLGQKVQDKVTSFVGIVTTAGNHITGCERYGVTGISNDRTKKDDEEFFSPDQIRVIEEGTDFTEQGEKSYVDHDYQLGEYVRDTITGFEGVICVMNYNLFNCPNFLIRNTSGDSSEEPDTMWLDVNRVGKHDGEGVIDEFSEDVENDVTEETGSVADSPNWNDSP